MVQVKEFRIRNNCTVEEYRIAQLFSVAKMSLNETGDGEGVEVIKNEPYDNELGKGQYTYKIYHLASRAPAVVRTLAPKDALELHEEAWNGYPSCRTVTTSPWMKDGFKMVTETMHLADRGDTENALNVSQEVLDQREVVYLDVADDSEVPKSACKPEEDPKQYKSKKTGRGPLKGDWAKTCDPVMTCYKLVTVEFKWWGFQTVVEALIMSYTRKAMLLMHRQLFCDTDEWHGMTIDELRELEDKTAKDLLEKRHKQLENKTDFS
ncbi:hypothetical protein LPJ78_001078 [Coemansia sp. RSA 989]|nr:phosphatidylinositol transfer protein beta isoform [Coemansia mojavensis]KAJ1739180.1 hypothetical protein LPJ68_004911 [Coemansia sp. RSA 1086]KAJ1747638.1 hypothetical protein LPJ79_005112 [Coemansia sp. RSA 1821]KAJ1867396.1 hypothetical protein LPJ78_001078 [Coemansia sp. RSA 989]KAJ1869621.1 hypothetical protein LPJ55_005236 [Coemansia sp. RSA 990]KAJ2630195.1 hypothetical protein H4R22_002836 [Coemansia sp. RSA 1290]KAJ2649260.1 hypothetical protein IWW40_003248 [Coemansia sp. RSA 12